MNLNFVLSVAHLPQWAKMRMSNTANKSPDRKGPKKSVPKGFNRERDRILRELKRVHVEVQVAQELIALDKQYKKVVSWQKAGVLPFISLYGELLG